MNAVLEELGHHFTWNFLKDLHSKGLTVNIQKRLRTEHETEPYARRHALMNLLGFVEVELKNLTAGQKLFETILEEDDKNYNAVRNLCTVFDRRGQSEHTKSQKCKETIKLLVDENSKEFQIVKARALYEKATAMSLTDQSYLHKDHEIAVKYFTEAFSLGKNVLEIHEMNDWLLGFGFLYQKMDSLYHRHEKKYFKEGMKLFYSSVIPSLLQQDGKMARLNTAKAWAFMGVLLSRRDPKFSTLSSIIDNETLQAEHKDYDDLQCLHMAVELTPNSTTVVRRLAQAYMKKGRFDESWHYFEKAKQLNPSHGYTYYLMGKWSTEKFKTVKEADRSLLDQAIKHFQQALDNNCDLVGLFCDFAEAYKLSGNFDDALDLCYQGSTFPGGDRFVQLYELWASILSETGNEEGAKDKQRYAEKLKLSIKVEKCDFGVIYSSKDNDVVKSVVAEIEKKYDTRGYYFERDCLPGSNIIFEFSDIEQNCRIIIMFVSENFLKSPACKHEMTEIIQIRISKGSAETIIPVVLGSVDFDSLPVGLKSNHGIRYPSDEFWPKIGRIFNP